MISALSKKEVEDATAALEVCNLALYVFIWCVVSLL